MMLVENVKKHIHVLASDIGERNMNHYENMQKAANYISQELTTYGYKTDLQAISCQSKIVHNVIAEHQGNLNPKKIVVVGAHYDTVNACPGANDNASGVAAMLEIARILKTVDIPITIHFVAFANEESPFIRTKEMGSYYYAKTLSENKENVIAMLSLETLGNYSNKVQTQKYSSLFPFWQFTDVGNFIAFISDFKSRSLCKKISTYFELNAPFRQKKLYGPSWLRGINSSDQWAFWKNGYPAVMITDTGPFRSRWHHKPEDTPEKINYPVLCKLIEVLADFLKAY
jgi:Zn-dependent M28 family amino/carboxypeptidase